MSAVPVRPQEMAAFPLPLAARRGRPPLAALPADPDDFETLKVDEALARSRGPARRRGTTRGLRRVSFSAAARRIS
jgi:hypothetical protein